MAKLVASATYTDQELLDLYREALAQVSVAQTYRMDGVEYTRASIPHLQGLIKTLETKIAIAAGQTAFNTVRLGRDR